MTHGPRQERREIVTNVTIAERFCLGHRHAVGCGIRGQESQCPWSPQQTPRQGDGELEAGSPVPHIAGSTVPQRPLGSLTRRQGIDNRVKVVLKSIVRKT